MRTTVHCTRALTLLMVVACFSGCGEEDRGSVSGPPAAVEESHQDFWRDKDTPRETHKATVPTR